MRWLRMVGGIIAVIAVILIWVVWGSLSFVAPKWLLETPTDRLGVWGDSFGALSSLFTALGFLAVIAGFRLQREQMRKGQDEQHRQRFDSWYFELLKLLREARDAVEFRNSNEYHKDKTEPVENIRNNQRVSSIRNVLASARQTFRGVDAFKAAWFELRYHLNRPGQKQDVATVGNIYEKFIHNRHESIFGPYFRLLYTILESIDSDPVLTQAEKFRYGRLLRSQLTSYETALAGFNGLSRVSKDFQRLVIAFRLLKYIPHGNRRRLLSRYYPANTFKARD